MSFPQATDKATCLITGASAGIGREFARQLAERGLGVTLVARREERLAELAQDISAKHSVRAEYVACNLADAGARAAMVEEVGSRGLEVELLVNNAGFGTWGSFYKLDPGKELDELRLNCEAVLDLSRAFLPGMVSKGRGGVINVASTAAFQPVPGMATYAATKAFVLSLSEALSDELRKTDVTVTAVCPGPVETEFSSVVGNEEIFNKTPNLAILGPDEVVHAALKSFEQGKRGSLPGLLNKLMVYSSRPMPTSLKLLFARRIFSH